MSILLHRTGRVLVMSHSDCATYGGLAFFKGDQAAEADHHRKELVRAGELLIENFPGVSVKPYFIKFDGIWEVKGADYLKSATSGTISHAKREIA